LSNRRRAAARHSRTMSNTKPDLFTNVHKGIRHALFTACVSLGNAEGDAEREAAARARLAEALHFVAHHGENEDLLLLPLLRERAPQLFAQISKAHADLDQARKKLLSEQPTTALYLAACAFTSQYLAHMDEEEHALEPAIRAVLSVEDAIAFGRRSVERTSPGDQRMMLGWMLPAMTLSDAEAFLSRLPPALAADLRALVSSKYVLATPAAAVAPLVAPDSRRS
jgi:hypothetical protein